MALVAFPTSVNAQGAEGASKQASAASFVHGGELLPPQLMLRASYYLYLDADADTGATSDETEPNAEEPKSAQAGGEGPSAKPTAEEAVQSTEPTGSRLARWHPEAFDDPSKPTSTPVYVDPLTGAPLVVPEDPQVPTAPPTEEQKRKRKKRRRIGIGVGVSVAVVVVFLAVAGGVVAKQLNDL
jgi:hypothetical protein